MRRELNFNDIMGLILMEKLYFNSIGLRLEQDQVWMAMLVTNEHNLLQDIQNWKLYQIMTHQLDTVFKNPFTSLLCQLSPASAFNFKALSLGLEGDKSCESFLLIIQVPSFQSCGVVSCQLVLSHLDFRIHFVLAISI